LSGLWRLTARRFFTPGYWIILAGMLVLLAIFSIPAAPDRATAADGLLPWAAGFYVCFLLPIFAFISSASAMRDSFGAATVDYVFTRPIRRPAFVVFRYLTQMLCTQIDFLFSFAVIIGLGVYHDVPGLWPALPTLLLGQVTAIVVFSAFGTACAALTSRYVIVGLLYAGIVEVGLGNVPTQINQMSLVRQVLGILRPVIGEHGDPLARLASVASLSQSGIVALLLAISIVLVAISALVFAVQEFTGSAGRDA
jgi:ABC-type transport system involved in multi-copper enzyme maturation permease subunit